jgi:hypothetical protein
MQTRTGTEQRRLDTLTLVHEHGWRVDSRHATSLVRVYDRRRAA